MAVTRLKRKAKRNKVKAKVRQATIQRLNSKPVIQGVDVEKIKEEFKQGSKGTAKAKKEAAPAEAKEQKAEPKKAAPKKAAKVEKEGEPKAEKKEIKKAAPKKEDKEDKE